MTYSIEPQIKLNGVLVDPEEASGEEESAQHGFTVEQDLSQPDMCSLILGNKNHFWGSGDKRQQLTPGNRLEISINHPDDGLVVIFDGEIVGLEPVYAAGESQELVVRAFNKLHRLLRGKNSCTYQNQTYQDIVAKIAENACLQSECHSSPAITHEHIYQHNQTDLAFIRGCGERIGFDVWAEGDKLFFMPPQKDQYSGISLSLEAETGDSNLESFYPRLSTAQLVEEVVVRGWNPETKEQIEGNATIQNSALGGRSAMTAIEQFPTKTYFEVDHPVFSVDEARAIAEAKLREMCMDFISGEATCIYQPSLKPGIVVDITINRADPTDRFNGKYFVVGATHHYKPGWHGYKTKIRVRRDAETG